jgi:iron complex outermembrane recepter protein
MNTASQPGSRAFRGGQDSPRHPSDILALTTRLKWIVCIAVCLSLPVARASAQAADTVAPASELKRLSLEELMQIEVTSVSKRSEKLSQTASAIQVITNEQIRRSGATSIPEALRLATNLQIAQVGAHQWAITARGFNSTTANKLLVLIDGRSVYTPLFSGVFWDIQDVMLSDIDRIEVISGPGGAVWGANAVNGVINIITKSAKDTQGAYAEAGGGSSPNGFADARYGGGFGTRSSFRVYGQYFDRDNELYANGDDAVDSWRMGHGGARLDARMSSRDALMVKADAYGGNENVPTGGTSTASGGNLTTRLTRVFSPNSDMSLQFYYDHTQLSNPEPASQFSPEGRLKDRLDTYDLDFEHRFAIRSRNHLVWGLGYRFTHDVVGNTRPIGFFPATLDHNLVSGFVQDEITVLPQLFLTLGTKLEHNDYTGFEAEPTARLRWVLSSTQMVWAAVSRAVRTPSRVDRDLKQPSEAPIILVGSDDFDSETLIAYELGYRMQVGSRLSASISGFYNDYDHVRSLSFTPATIIPLFFANDLAGETHGFEVSATYQAADWWQLRAGLDVLKERLHVKAGRADINNALNETADPEQQFSLWSSFDLPQHVEIDLGPRWVGKIYNNDNGATGTVPSYTDMDVRIGWHPVERIGLSVVGQNILHDHHPEFGIPDPSREEIRRTVYGKITWQF